jgi:hypothetical protein
MAGHLLRREHLVDQNQAANDFSHRTSPHLAIGDAWVIAAPTGIAQEISVVRHNHTSFTSDEVKVLRVVKCTQPCLDRCRDVNAMAAQRSSDVWANVLVQAVP